MGERRSFNYPQDPDDPYQVSVVREEDGSITIAVSAQTLGDSEEVRAECDRRAQKVRASFEAFMKAKEN